jgi:hypothetical protein
MYEEFQLVMMYSALSLPVYPIQTLIIVNYKRRFNIKNLKCYNLYTTINLCTAVEE